MKFKYVAINILRFFCGAKTPPAAFPEQIKSIVLLAPERYGDLILLTPVIQHLRHQYPDVRITLVGANDLVFFFQADRHVEKMYNGKKTLFCLHGLLFTETYDLLYNPKDHPSFVFLLLTCRIKAAYKVGIAHPLHRQFYHKLLPVEAKWSKMQINCALLAHLKIDKPYDNTIRPYMPPGPVSEEIKQFAVKYEKEYIVAVNLSASKKIRQWPVIHWQTFLNQVKESVIIIAMPQQMPLKKILEEQYPSVVVSPPTRTLFDAAHLIGRCQLLITPDTALVHVASALNRPLIGLYTHRSEYGKFSALSDIKEILFSECETIHTISPQQVLTAYHAIMQKISP
jgi:heptosyltransferase-3